MAADSLLPMFHDTGRMDDGPSHSDDVLTELLGEAGDDLLASLLEPNSAYLGQLSPPLSSPTLPISPPHHTTTDASPSCDGTVSDGSSLNRAHSPYSYTCSPVDMLGTSPESASSGDIMVTSSTIVPTDELDALLGTLTGGGSSCDIKIDLDDGMGKRGVAQAESCPVSTSSSRKAASLVLTEEEKQLLKAEGVELPIDMPLTKNEQRHLKKVRRKIKNKLSAQESRRRKKEYVEGLEERVQCCTDTNNRLRQRVDSLENENNSLMEQLNKLRSIVARLYPSKLQAGTLLMVLSLSFSLLVFPWPHPHDSPLTSYTVTVHSRALLFTETDEFGNIIDPDSGTIVSHQGELTPKPPYPWSLQTPAFLSTLSLTPTSAHHNKPDL